MSSNEIEERVVDAILHVQSIARNPGADSFKDYGKPSEMISSIRKHLFRKPIRSAAGLVKRKYVKRAKSELSRKIEEESSGDSMPVKHHKATTKSHSTSHTNKKNKEDGKSEHVKVEKKEVSLKKAIGGYCIDCNLSIESPKEPWKSLSPCKSAQKANRGKYQGQSQQQIETYLDCVSTMYNSRNSIPQGLHDTQLYLFDRAKVLGRLCADIAPTNPIENWTPHEIAIFEAAISVFGKEFYRISKCIKTKTTQQVIEFYYSWKFSSHYYAWKAHYRSPYEDVVVRGG